MTNLGHCEKIFTRIEPVIAVPLAQKNCRIAKPEIPFNKKCRLYLFDLRHSCALWLLHMLFQECEK